MDWISSETFIRESSKTQKDPRWEIFPYRFPKTTQERRANGSKPFLEIDGYIVKIRISRLMHHLPHFYDDVVRDDLRRHWSWKKMRKTQWK